jgi:hypothetical protein
MLNFALNKENQVLELNGARLRTPPAAAAWRGTAVEKSYTSQVGTPVDRLKPMKNRIL